MTIIDRYSRWLEAIPLADITAKSCATALLRHWVARFGVPASIVTDQGRQFTSELWSSLSRSLGISRKMTTAYHPQSNGMIEHQHRTLKDRLISRACATGSTGWMDHLPFVLLGLRSSIRGDSACSPSDLLYGAPLRLPGPMLDPLGSPAPDSLVFALHLRAAMCAASPLPVLHHGVPPARIDSRLHHATHVFLRVDAVRRPLVPPYEGPYPVISRSAKTFVILKREKPVTVTVDRLKPADLLPDRQPGPGPRPRPLSGSPAPDLSSAEVSVARPASSASDRIPASVDSSLPPPPDCPDAWPSLPAPLASSRTASGRVSRPVRRYQA